MSENKTNWNLNDRYFVEPKPFLPEWANLVRDPAPLIIPAFVELPKALEDYDGGTLPDVSEIGKRCLDELLGKVAAQLGDTNPENYVLVFDSHCYKLAHNSFGVLGRIELNTPSIENRRPKIGFTFHPLKQSK